MESNAANPGQWSAFDSAHKIKHHGLPPTGHVCSLAVSQFAELDVGALFRAQQQPLCAETSASAAGVCKC